MDQVALSGESRSNDAEDRGRSLRREPTRPPPVVRDVMDQLGLSEGSRDERRFMREPSRQPIVASDVMDQVVASEESEYEPRGCWRAKLGVKEVRTTRMMEGDARGYWEGGLYWILTTNIGEDLLM